MFSVSGGPYIYTFDYASPIVRFVDMSSKMRSYNRHLDFSIRSGVGRCDSPAAFAIGDSHTSGNDHARRTTKTAGPRALPQTVVYLVPEAGFEPARPHRAKDFKSPASAIPPLRHVSAASVEVSIRSIPRLHPVTPCAHPAGAISPGMRRRHASAVGAFESWPCAMLGQLLHA